MPSYPPRTCLTCEEIFIPNRTDKLACSPPCAKTAHARKAADDQRYEMEFCPLCEQTWKNLDGLADHMLSSHKRLILEQDLNAVITDRIQRVREMEAEEELLLC